MNSFSKLDLIGEEMKKLTSKGIEKWIYKLQPRQVLVSIQVPTELYFRAEILIEDIQDLSQSTFSQNHLINLLYTDFLREVKKTGNISHFYRRLAVRETRQPQIKMAHTTENLEPTETRRMSELTITMPRKDALRGEVFLTDLANMYPDHPFKLEHILEILYVDFLEAYKKGSLDNVIDKIVKRIAHN